MDHEAIYSAYAGTVVSIDDAAGAFDKDGKSVELDDAKVAAARKSIDDAYAATKYQRDRAAEYKELKEQFDLLYHDMTVGKGDNTGEWYKHIKAVKDANPKG